MVSGTMDNGYQDYQLEAAVSKIFSSEAEAKQILGGTGFMRDYGLEKAMRDLRGFRIFDGTNGILRIFIALTGMQHTGAHLKELHKAVSSTLSMSWIGKNAVAPFGILMDEASKRTKGGLSVSNKNLSEKVHPNLADAAAVLSQDVSMFGTSVEKVLIKHGKEVINQ